MRAITIHQPWAQLIALGLKQYETRSWRTGYRGPIAIHAGKAWKREQIAQQCEFVHCLRREFGANDQRVLTFEENPPLGAIVAIANLVLCKHISCHLKETWVETLPELERRFGDFSKNRFGWKLADVRKLSEPVNLNGHQGLWDVPVDIISRLPGPLLAQR